MKAWGELELGVSCRCNHEKLAGVVHIFSREGASLHTLLPKEAVPFLLTSLSLFLTLEGLKLLPVRMGGQWGVGKHTHTDPFLSIVG